MNTRNLSILVLLLAGCGSSVSSDQDAKNAYLGLDPSIDKAITLGFQGYNAASSANIPDQTASGTVSGTLTVTGHVDQGSDATSKIMNLTEQLTNYSDDGKITYVTNAALPALSMSLKGIPTGTLNGTLVGIMHMSGALGGDVTLNLTFTGTLMAGQGGTVTRQPNTTHITGTATSSAGTYNVDVTR